jgi:hypothetical protein
MRRFSGPATRHLAGYAAWFATRVESGVDLSAVASISRPGEPTNFRTWLENQRAGAWRDTDGPAVAGGSLQ